jgi:hypothetical protein
MRAHVLGVAPLIGWDVGRVRGMNALAVRLIYLTRASDHSPNYGPLHTISRQDALQLGWTLLSEALAQDASEGG